MNINSGVSTGYNQTSQYGPQDNAKLPNKQGDVKDEVLASGPQRLNSSFASDSLTAFSSPNSYSSPKKSVNKQKILLKRLRKTKRILTGISLLSAVFFFMAASQPFLVMILTLGDCLKDSYQGWMDFSSVILQLSLIPAGIALMTGLVGLGVSRFYKKVKTVKT